MGTLFRRLLRGISIPVLGSLRYLTTLAIVCGLWWYDAHLLNFAFDQNLALIKSLGTAVDGSGRVEAAMRAFAAEKMLLFTEASVLVWTAGKILCWPFGFMLRRWRKPPSPTEPEPQAQTSANPSAPLIVKSSAKPESLVARMKSQSE